MARASCSLICSTSPVSINRSPTLTRLKTRAAWGPVSSTSTWPRARRLRVLLSSPEPSMGTSSRGMPSSRSQSTTARRRSTSFMGCRLSAIRRKVPRARLSRYWSERTWLT
ncbi:hypothetical protein D3C76_1205790 [compost metagenome]